MKAYGYVRISKDEQGEGKESIESQKKLIQRYCLDNNINLIDILEDVGVSGFYFEEKRKGLQSILELIKNSRCNCIIFKDFSRFGRKNSEVLILTDMFREKNIRFISISDNYDSFETEDDILGILTWANERYSKDISKKVKTSIRNKQIDSGLVITPPYGYIKDKSIVEFEYIKGKRKRVSESKYIINPNTEKTIKTIFEKYIEGYGYKKIAEYLNENNIPTPRMEKEMSNGKYRTGIGRDKWYHTAILKILQDEAYIGNLICGKTKRNTIKGKRINVNEGEQFRHIGYFEPIIDKEVFYLAQEIRNNRNKNNVRAKEHTIGLLSGLLKCESCGSNLISTNRKRTHGYTRDYRCGLYHKYGKNQCTPHTINEEILIDYIKSNINKLRWCKNITLTKIDSAIKELQIEKKDYTGTLEKLKKQKQEINSQIADLIIKHVKGIIKSEEAYEQATKHLELEDKIVTEQIENITIEMKNDISLNDKILDSLSVLKQIENTDDLDVRIITILIDKIIVKENYINDEKNIEVSILWNEPFDLINKAVSPCGGGNSLEDKIKMLVSLYLKAS
jgi:DNA invertase Pin-like site-specific DNA recombinase